MGSQGSICAFDPGNIFPDRKRIREYGFPVTLLKFPVPVFREFSQKAPCSREFLDAPPVRIGPKIVKFPVFSLGSQQTALSATQSVGFRSNLEKAEIPREMRRCFRP